MYSRSEKMTIDEVEVERVKKQILSCGDFELRKIVGELYAHVQVLQDNSDNSFNNLRNVCRILEKQGILKTDVHVTGEPETTDQ